MHCRYASGNGSCRLDVPAHAYDDQLSQCGLHARQRRGLESSGALAKAQATLDYLATLSGRSSEVVDAQLVGISLPAEYLGDLVISRSTVSNELFSQLRSIGLLRIFEVKAIDPIEFSDVTFRDKLFVESLTPTSAVTIQRCDPQQGVFINRIFGPFNLSIKAVSASKIISINHCDDASIRVEDACDLAELELRAATRELRLVRASVGYLKAPAATIWTLRGEDSKVVKMNLQKAHLQGSLAFERCTFQEFDLFDATLSQGLAFKECSFGESLNLSSSKMADIPEARFLRVCFAGAANFSNRKFLGQTNFSGSVFCQAPNFHNCGLHQNTMFPNASAFLDVKSEGAAAAYRTLKLFMENLRARAEEGMFFALEQRARRDKLGRGQWFDKATSWAYQLFSNFGQSYARPAVALIFLWFAFAAVFAALISAPFDPQSQLDASVIRRSLVLSFEQIASPFGIWRKEALVGAADVPLDLVQVIASIESLLALILLALLLLALRWRFKRD